MGKPLYLPQQTSQTLQKFFVHLRSCSADKYRSCNADKCRSCSVDPSVIYTVKVADCPVEENVDFRDHQNAKLFQVSTT